MTTHGVSLKALGLRITDLDCPDGGQHHVPTQALVVASAAGGGSAACVKCHQVLALEKL